MEKPEFAKVYHRDDAKEVVKQAPFQSTDTTGRPVIMIGEKPKGIGCKRDFKHGFLRNCGEFNDRGNGNIPTDFKLTHFILLNDSDEALPKPTNKNAERIRTMQQKLAELKSKTNELESEIKKLEVQS